MDINGKTKVACLIGHPVSHSFSPYIHNFLAEKYEVDLKYTCFDVQPNEVKAALESIRALGMIGSNVTIPYKIEVMSYLDEIDKNAGIIGAVNTIKNEDGKLIGYNTDGVGFIKSVLDAGHEIEGKHIMILGAGGASRAVGVELASHGVGEISIRNNTLEKAELLAETIKAHFSNVKVNVASLAIEEKDLEGIDILINTTPLGMSSRKDLSPIDEKIVPPSDLVVCDIVYTPHDTKLLKWAMKNELSVVHGIGMLINQAIHSFHIWTGLEIEAYDEVYALLKRLGVVE